MASPGAETGASSPFSQRVWEQKRETEILQATDRLRLVHAPTPKPVSILPNLPLDMTVDEVVSLDPRVRISALLSLTGR